MKKQHIIYYIVLAALVSLFAIYTATRFPYTYITMEGDDFWVLTKDFWHIKLAMLPAATNWLSDWLMQFYSSPFVGASIGALVLGAIGLLAAQAFSAFSSRTKKPNRKASSSKKPRRNTWLCWIGLVPPVLLGYYCPFCLAFQLQWLFFFVLLLAYQSIPHPIGKALWSLLCVPIGFMLMRTPMLFLLIAMQAVFILLRREEGKKAYLWGGMAGAVALLVIAPLTYSQQVAFIPYQERYTKWGANIDPLTSRNNLDGEQIKMMTCLANEQRWEDVLYKAHAKREAQRGKALALRYALLAESALGTLPDNLLDYPISNENMFYYPHEGGHISLQFNRLFYLNLGVYDEAFHHAQEYGLLQANNICFSSLRQMVDYSIEEGDFETSEKFLCILDKSSCHKPFVESRRKILSDSKSGNQQRKAVSLRADNFVGGFPLPIEMLRLARYFKERNGQQAQDPSSAEQDNSQIRKMVDYAICSYLLRNDKERFIIATKAFDVYKDKELPRAYREYLNR